MLPEMTMTKNTATDGADAPEDDIVMKQYADLSEESKKRVNKLVEQLLNTQKV